MPFYFLNWVGTITVLASLAAARATLLHDLKPEEGLSMLLPHQCKAMGDGRPVFVRYGLDHSSWSNWSYYPVEDDLRRGIASTMGTRWERVVYLAADERLTYGEVAQLVSDLQLDDPMLHVAMMMKEQVGARGFVRPTEAEALCL